MKTIKFKFLVLLLVFATSCNLNAQKKHTMVLKKDKLIEVALLSVKEGKADQLNNDYFSQVMPLAARSEYGGRSIANFVVTRKVIGDNPAQMVVFYEWASLEAKRAFETNPEYLALRNIRNDALNFLAQGFFKVEQDVTIDLYDNKVYDFAALWIDPTNAPKLQQYFEAVVPVASDPKYGYTPIATLMNYGVTDLVYHPSLIAFAEWKGGPNAVDQFGKTEAYKKNVHLREAATPYKDVFHLKLL